MTVAIGFLGYSLSHIFTSSIFDNLKKSDLQSLWTIQGTLVSISFIILTHLWDQLTEFVPEGIVDLIARKTYSFPIIIFNFVVLIATGVLVFLVSEDSSNTQFTLPIFLLGLSSVLSIVWLYSRVSKIVLYNGISNFAISQARDEIDEESWKNTKYQIGNEILDSKIPSYRKSQKSLNLSNDVTITAEDLDLEGHISDINYRRLKKIFSIIDPEKVTSGPSLGQDFSRENDAVLRLKENISQETREKLTNQLRKSIKTSKGFSL
ncbi:hypothetical protein ACK3SF_01795 [Candidatus Nanosalina sp. VS9-1]|uniref:hypothetical protein n=1 Tax=Candidatus Nanosalina sp. VS9-1 TaxID=3388566 RepID=UPI0039E1835A